MQKRERKWWAKTTSEVVLKSVSFLLFAVFFLELKKKKSELSKENTNLKNEVAKKDNEISSVKHELEEMNQNLTEAFSRLDEKEMELENSESEKQALEKECAELKLSLDVKRHDVSSAQKSVEQRKCEVERLHRELQSTVDKKTDAENNLQEMLKKNSELKKTLTVATESLNDLKKLYAGVNQDLNRFKGEVQCLESLKQNLERERDRAIAEYVESRSNVEHLRRDKEKYIEDSRALKTEVATLKDLLADTRKQVRSSEETNSELKRALNQYERNGEDIIDENARLKNDNQILQIKLTKMENETLSEVTEKYTESIRLRAEMDALRNELRKRNRAFESQSSNASSEIDAVENSHKREMIMLKTQIEKLTEEEARVKSELNTTKNKFQVYMKDRARIENELREKSLELERERSLTQNLDREKSLLQSRVDRLKAAGSKRAENAASDHKNKISYLEQQVKALKTTHALEMEAKKVELDSLTRQIELATSVEQSKKFFDLSVNNNDDEKDKNNNTAAEQQIRSMREQFRLKSQMYEKEIEFINLKYSLVLAENGEGKSEEIKNILHDMSMVEREKQELDLEWENTFG